MLKLPNLLSDLGYSTSPHYRRNEKEFEPETAYLFRSARKAQVDGVYVVQASSNRSVSALPPRLAVFVAEAATAEHAREIHKRMWNLGAAPFLLIILPHQIRVYTAFEYSPALDKGTGKHGNERGLLQICDEPLDVVSQLVRFSAAAIDSGQVWESNDYRERVDSRLRVDTRLLDNLSKRALS